MVTRYAPIVFLYLLILSACGGEGNSNSASEEIDTNQNNGQETDRIPDEEVFATTLLFPGNKAAFLGDAANFIGTIKEPFRSDIQQISVTVDGISVSADIRENHVWVAPNVQLSNQFDTTVTITSTRSNGGELVDVYHIYRTIPFNRTSNMLINENGDKAFLVEGNSKWLYSIDLSSGYVEPVVELDVVNVPDIAWGKQENYLYSLDLNLQLHDIETGNSFVISDMNLDPAPDSIYYGANSDLAIDEINNRALAMVGTSYEGKQVDVLYGVDLSTGALTEISGAEIGTGDTFYNASNIDFDPATGTTFVADFANDKGLFTVDNATGDRTRLVSDTTIRNPGSVSFNHEIGLLYVDSSIESIYEVDVNTGGVEEILKQSSGENKTVIKDIVVNEVTNQLIVMDAVHDKIESINLDTREKRTILSTRTDVFGEPLYEVLDIEVDVGNSVVYYLDSAARALGKFNIDSGRRHIVSSSSPVVSAVGEGPAYDSPVAFEIDFSTNIAYVLESRGTIYSVDIDTGNRTELSGKNAGAGVEFERASAMSLDLAGKRIFVGDSSLHAIIEVDMVTGDRALLSDNATSTPAYVDIEGLVFDEVRNVLWVANSDISTSDARNHIIAVEPGTGYKTLMVDRLEGGINGVKPESIDLDTETGLLHIGASDSKLFMVNPETAEVTETQNSEVSQGTLFNFVCGLRISSATGIAFIADCSYNKIYAVDLATGNSALIHP